MDTPWTIRVEMLAAAARRRRSTWVVAAIGSPPTRRPTFWFVAACRIRSPRSTSSRLSRRGLLPMSRSSASTEAPERADV